MPFSHLTLYLNVNCTLKAVNYHQRISVNTCLMVLLSCFILCIQIMVIHVVGSNWVIEHWDLRLIFKFYECYF